MRSITFLILSLSFFLSCKEHVEHTSDRKILITDSIETENNSSINSKIKSWNELELSDNQDTALALFTYRILYTNDKTEMNDCVIRQNLIESSKAVKKLLPLLFPNIETQKINQQIDSLNRGAIQYAKRQVDLDAAAYGIITEDPCYDLWKKNTFTLDDAKSLINSINEKSTETKIHQIIYQTQNFYPYTDSIFDYIIKNDKNYSAMNGCIGLPTSLSYEFYHIMLNNYISQDYENDSIIWALDKVILKNKKLLLASKAKNNNIASLEDHKKLRLIGYVEEHQKNKFILPTFEVDDYPITTTMLKEAKKVKKPILSFDGVWFSHKKETIAIALYTDYYRSAIFHFLTDDIPTDLLNSIELHTPEHKQATIDSKEELLVETFPKINELENSYFTTNKGFKLGTNISKIITIYGPPDSTTFENEISILHWRFIGDTFYMGQNLKGKPLAKNSYGHELIMYFEEEKLIGLIMYNDIP